MSYSDVHQARSAKPIIAVALLHAVIAYGFISGLAYEVIPYDYRPIVAREIPDDTPPPPKVLPQPQRQPIKRSTLVMPDSVIERPDLGQREIVEVTMQDIGKSTQPELPPVSLNPPAHVSQARGAAVIGSRGAWVTADDYPPAALRQAEEGTVGISVTIGADGRVSGCEVTATSGSALLDQQTCRTYTRRARFTPALDDDGRPVAAHRADRVRWQLPAQ